MATCHKIASPWLHTRPGGPVVLERTLMDATALLQTPLSNARSVMGQDALAIKRAFKALAGQWHPDACADPQAAAVFAHIVALRDAALGARKPSLSRPRRVFVCADGGRVAMSPLGGWTSETGETLVGRKAITVILRPDCADLADGLRARWAGLRYADDRMRAAFAPLAPTPSPAFNRTLEDGSVAMTLVRPEGFVGLVDLLRHLGGRMEPVHAAWLGSGLYNLVAWFQWMGLAHAGLSVETVWVNPTTHGVAVLGGWEFATALGARPEALPASTLRALPRLEASGEVVDGATDLVLVRDIIRVALGDSARITPQVAGLPAAVAKVIAAPPAADARTEYAAWIAALVEGWGPRRFQVLDVRDSDVYPDS